MTGDGEVRVTGDGEVRGDREDEKGGEGEALVVVRIAVLVV